MKAKWVSVFLTVTLLAVTVVPTASATGNSPAPDKIVVGLYGTSSVGGLNTALTGTDALGTIDTEIPNREALGSSPLRGSPGTGNPVPLSPGSGGPHPGGKEIKSNAEVILSFEGLNHRDSRLAFGGNQFSGEPADQGLCVGNGYIMESVNSAVQVYDVATGAEVTPVMALNEFYGFPPAIDRNTFTFGPFTFDISCHYDPDSNRWFHLAVDLDQDPQTGAFTGKNYLDLAVSTSGDPTGSWNVYRIPGMNDGTEGTPDHECPGGPCFADFPHIGVDKYGVYISTNEFPLFEDGFTGAQVYAISKSALASGAASIDVYLFNTAQPAWEVRPDEPGFTVWPALSADKQFAGSQGGTEYFVSSNAVFDDVNGDSDEIIVWALSNTKSLQHGAPNLKLTRKILHSITYAIPPASVQKPGTIPLGELFYGATEPGVIDTSDSRVLDVRYANGKLWAVLGTAVEVEGEQLAGVGWFILNPSVNHSGVNATIRKQGILALPHESLAYPTLGVTANGRGLIGFTRVGADLHPSVGYATINAFAGVGPVHMIAEGNSPQDGFSEYEGGRARWGDYGAAAVDGHYIYLAGQYIEQPACTVDDFINTGGSCFGYRTTFANWSTRVTKLKP